LPGSIMYRVSPLDMTFDNLTIAGDWTATGLDSGCIESAVMSGLLASHAISQRPLLHEIIGYDHP
jgi:Flavin containing amine oxidoreductase